MSRYQLGKTAYKIKKVELIISGHVHNYQRFPKNTEGNIYLTVGTGGARRCFNPRRVYQNTLKTNMDI